MTTEPGPKRRPRFLAALCLVAAVGLGCRDERMEVVRLEWERAVSIERYAREAAGAWRDQLPEEASAVVCSPRSQRGGRTARSIRRLLSPHSQRGELVPTRPVWELESNEAQWCQYERRRWVPARVERAGGAGRARAWPAVELAAGEREAGRAERCIVVLRDAEEREVRFEPDCETWSDLAIGASQAVQLERGRVVRLLP